MGVVAIAVTSQPLGYRVMLLPGRLPRRLLAKHCDGNWGG